MSIGGAVGGGSLGSRLIQQLDGLMAQAEGTTLSRALQSAVLQLPDQAGMQLESMLSLVLL